RKPWLTRSSLSRSPSVGSSRTMYPCRPASRMAASASSAKYGLFSSGMASAMMPVRPLRRWRADRFGLYPSSSMARRTRSRVASLTGRYPLTTLDTVATETPARRAMSLRFTPATGSPDPLGTALGTAEIGLHDDHHDEERAAGHRL